jgi:hypothetical protein
MNHPTEIIIESESISRVEMGRLRHKHACQATRNEIFINFMGWVLVAALICALHIVIEIKWN